MDCTVTPEVGVSGGRGREGIGGEASVVLHLGEFLGRTASEESARLGVTVEELVTFALLYYLADLDGERIARRMPPGA